MKKITMLFLIILLSLVILPISSKATTSLVKKGFKNIELYYYGKFAGYGDLTALEWLKKNNQELYYYGKFAGYGDLTALEWLKKNNQGLYYYGKFAGYGDKIALDWLKNN